MWGFLRWSTAAPGTWCHRCPYNAYLKGRFHWNKRSPEGVRLGLRCFEGAVALDPDWALGWAGLGDSLAVLAENGLLPQETAIPAANRAAERATSLDPNLAEAYATLGLLRSRYDWKWDEAAVFFSPGHRPQPRLRHSALLVWISLSRHGCRAATRRQSNNTGCCWTSSRPSTKRGRHEGECMRKWATTPGPSRCTKRVSN